MNSIQLLIIILALLFLFVIISGVIISKSGKPYKNLILVLHKLFSLAFLLLAAFIVYAYYKAFDFKIIFNTILIITGSLTLIATFGTGGKLTVGEEISKKLQIGHKVTSLCSLLILGFLFYRFYMI